MESLVNGVTCIEGRETVSQDNEWINRVLEGDQDAYRNLIERHRGNLYKLVWGVLLHTKDAEDALQEALIRIYCSLPQYRGQGFQSWASRIAINIAIDAKRKKMRQPEILSDTIDSGASSLQHTPKYEAYTGDHDGAPQTSRGLNHLVAEPYCAHSQPAEVEALKREKRSRIRKLVESMPTGYSNAVRSFYLEQKNQQEIAIQEQIAVKSVESRLHRAKQWMRRHWKEEDLE